MSKCNLCPRRCGADRIKSTGFCRSGETMHVSRVALHKWEEPPISGTHGSGTIFFSGCNLRCVFCQNREISREPSGREYEVADLVDAMKRLEAAGAHNINLVTPTHFADKIREALAIAKPDLGIPVVYNCGGYESTETIRSLSGLVDIYLPDVKYFSPELSGKYSSAPDYFAVASEALGAMLETAGAAEFDESGLMKKGVIVRHLVLPGQRRDSAALLGALAGRFGTKDYKISLMRQYTPDFVDREKYPELSRRVTSFEYDYVVSEAARLGFDGFTQMPDSATSEYSPSFNRDSDYV